MAWMPGVKKMELEPESTNQVAINPTQFIMHSIAAPWSGERIYEYWDDSTNLESHFGLPYDGEIFQYIGTQTRADANASANNRAVSIETASNLKHTDPWTEAQIQSLIEIGVWLHKQHGIPLRICRSWTDPGFGYHRLFREWSTTGTDCPGDARVEQFKTRVFPGIVAAVNGEDDMAISEEDVNRIARAVWNATELNPATVDPNDRVRMGAVQAWRDQVEVFTRQEIKQALVPLHTKLDALIAALNKS